MADDLGRAFEVVGEQGAGLVLDAERGEEIASLQSFTTLEHAAGRGRFHPASTVKPLLVHAALERGVIQLYDAWLVAAAPADTPQIVLVIQTVASGPAPRSAAMVAGEFLGGWTQRRRDGVSEARR